MPIVLLPIDTSAPSPASCATQLVVTPNVPLHNGCPVLTKSPSITVAKGQEATVEWIMRSSDGEPVDITSCIEDDGLGNEGSVTVRIKEALNPSAPVYEIEATVLDADSGKITFDLPPEVANHACLYQIEIAVINQSGRIVFTNKGLLSVERGLFGENAAQSVDLGPITLEEVRMQLRDILAENDNIEDVEFDDADILHSMLQPIRFWNEIPPDVCRYDACNFPYHNAWLKATCANLLRTIATWYERNYMASQHGGVTDNRRNKLNPYLTQYKMYEAEWREFVERKKIEINVNSCFGCA